MRSNERSRGAVRPTPMPLYSASGGLFASTRTEGGVTPASCVSNGTGLRLAVTVLLAVLLAALTGRCGGRRGGRGRPRRGRRGRGRRRRRGRAGAERVAVLLVRLPRALADRDRVARVLLRVRPVADQDLP